MSANDTSQKAGGTLSPADRLEIHELIARYNIVEDSGDIEGWIDTFTKDGGFSGPRGKNPVAGHDALRQYGHKRAERPDIGSLVHWVSNVVITPTAEGAMSQCYVILVQHPPGGALRVERLVVKTDELRRENGKWQFKSRVSAPWPEFKIEYQPPGA